MTVFPVDFSASNVMNSYDRSRETVEWNKFKGVVLKHFKTHTNLRMSVRTRKDSLFRDCDCDRLLAAGDTVPDMPPPQRNDKGSRQNIPALQLFNDVEPLPLPLVSPKTPSGASVFVPTTYDECAPREPSIDAQLQSYIPIFIWAYNTLKLTIIDESVAIRDLRAMHVRLNRIMETFRAHATGQRNTTVTAPTEDLKHHFAFGTASEERKKAHWKSFVARTQHEGLGRCKAVESIANGSGHCECVC